MARCEKPYVTVVSGKGQVVIPHAIRKKLDLKPKTRLLVYTCQDAVILKKLEVPAIDKKLEAVYKRLHKRIAKYGEMTQVEIDKIIHEHRSAKRTSAKTHE